MKAGNKFLARFTCLLTLFIHLPGTSLAAEGELIPHQVFTLKNGLTLVVHEDDRAPVVAVNIWYHVGSKNEKPGQTGYAHLFEHLMFQGSENTPPEYISLLAEMGATDLNGTTWFDRTNYFQTVPVGALDRTLFLESDRMGHMLGVIDQEILDEQRDVVQNEKRQRDNQPYASVWERMLPQIFPPGHPYSWTTMGSLEDLEVASLQEMREWFKTYYGPNNAVLVVAGDVKAKCVRKRVDRYFGDIPAGPPLAVQDEWIPRHTTERRIVVEDRVAQERLYLAWSGPRWGTAEASHMRLAADILARGKNSRLYRRLVYTEQLASDLDLAAYFFEIAGLVILQASVKPGEDIAEVERILREVLQEYANEGPTSQELRRVKAENRSRFLRGLEKQGGWGGKSSVLAEYAVYGGDPGGYQRYLDDIDSATLTDLQEVTEKWLGSQAPFVAQYIPFPDLGHKDQGVDRSTLPEQEEPESARFPEFSKTRLDNGLELIVVERPGLPLVNLSLLVRAGYADDPDTLPGQASFAMAMLDEGTAGRNALEISEQLSLLGAELDTSAGLDTSSVTLSALTDNLDESLQVFGDIVLNPTFPASEMPRLRSQLLTKIQQEKSRPMGMALRVMPGILYGKEHPYAQPLTGSGTEASVQAITQQGLESWHQQWFRPNNATLIVVGDTSAADMKGRIEQLFRSWRPGDIPQRDISQVRPRDLDTIYLIDKPGAVQSIIFAGQLIAPMINPREVAIEAMNDVLGGQFSARINMNLREQKSWSYGARSMISTTAAQRPWLIYAPVQIDKTAPALAEIHRELSEFLGDRPASKEELERVKRSNILSLSGRWETNGPCLFPSAGCGGILP